MNSAPTATAQGFTIKFNGQKATQDFWMKVYSVEIEKNLHLPDVFTIRLHLGSVGEKPFDAVDEYMKDFLSNGVEVEISQHINRRDRPIVVGEVTSIELDLSSLVPGAAPAAVIRGYDRSHRLHRGRHTLTFTEMTYSEIASKVAREAGLSADVDSTSPSYQHVLQCNQTNWEFLWQMARRVGYELYIDGKTLCFKRPWNSDGRGSVDLEWGNSLVQFRVTGSTMFQTSEVEVRSWDQKEKKSIIGKATSGDGSPRLKNIGAGSDEAKKAFGDSKLTVVDTPVYSQSEADTVAQSLADSVAADFVVAEGATAEGMPDVLPGAKLNITGVGPSLGGEYYVTAASHVFSRADGYSTSFTVSGRRPDTLLSFLDPQPATDASRYATGVVVGVVTNNNDEEDLSRVKVKYPCLGDTIESGWARIAAPGAGKDRGMHWLPEVDDEVLIAFENGDVNRPYVLGGLWSKPDAPPAKTSEVVGSSGKSKGQVNQRTVASRSGHVITLDDSDGEEKIIIRDKTGSNEVVIDSAENTLTISADQDVTVQAKGKLTLSGDQEVEIKAGSKSLKLSASGNTDLDGSSGQVNVKGVRINLN